jgi:formylglycine-generating enzyme required for sulfatase activity
MKTFTLVLCLVGCTSQSEPVPFTQKIEGTDFTIEMVPVTTRDGFFWISRTEVPWDLYDIFLQFINSPDNLSAGVDAVTGPTPAYASVDRGFGRSGYPAISMSSQAAKSFCSWLSSKTNRTFQIPSIEQWNNANAEGGSAWHQWNSEKTTHPVATKEPNSLGIHDMEGNVGEWVITPEGPRVIGGSFRTPPENLGSKSLLTPVREWNITDPQLPRSPWWFADADFVGLRIICTNGEENE